MAGTKEHHNARSRHRKQFWRDRDKEDHTCPWCGSTWGDVADFEIHHIDGDPTNGDEENLVAVCRSCHYREHDRTPPTDLESWKEGFLDLG